MENDLQAAAHLEQSYLVAASTVTQLPSRHSTRQGDLSGHWRIASVAQASLLSAWHDVQGFGILYFSLIAGVMNANVCARTFTSEMVVSICGM